MGDDFMETPTSRRFAWHEKSARIRCRQVCSDESDGNTPNHSVRFGLSLARSLIKVRRNVEDK